MTGKRDFLVGKRVTVIGLGIEGVDVARFAATHGAASVTVIDAKLPEALTDRLEQLRELPIRYELGPSGNADPADSDVVFASQGVPMSHPTVVAVQERGIRLSSMTREFMEHCPGPTIGITGSSGKTTTASLVAHMLATAGRPYRVGGNIGTGLLGILDGLNEHTWTVMEMSHTQLAMTDRSPHIASILNVTPNHLDQFRWDDYVALKQKIVRFQSPDDHVVLNLDDAIAAASAELTPARLSHFTVSDDVPGDGAFVRDGAIFVRGESIEEMVLPTSEIPLRGQHNVANAVAATAIARAAGIGGETIAAAIRSFAPIPHRLETVGEVDGVRYVNDSIATTPERTLAGIRSFSEPLVLLLGGRDKDLPKDELAREAMKRCHAIVFFGQDGQRLHDAFAAEADDPENNAVMFQVTTLAEAMKVARAQAEPGEVVLLSPACTSFDAYRNFEERGDQFRRFVQQIGAEAR
ncbi:MAG: UDP-N-acetylmuramoyl-L-alanine--D-glutamate ligase [Dehalococcoidia bacterium]